ncbi:hypothetical protein PR048_028343 [Dryococelus australis]|uniref:Caspase family p20 domain-containing protein n=1 Tax=Dryococelus australis TaxID=614101 RepID=A0ABQ9GJ18_9NEOP|nr:hypothetical protein PR048_028343 [Dryococelus australis]
MILSKGKYSKKEFGNDLPSGSVLAVTPNGNDLTNSSVSAMTPKGYITKEEFCNFLRHFNSRRIPGKVLFIFYGHRSH